MKRFTITMFAFLIGFSLVGCASYVVPKPSAITLEDALTSVGRGLVQMKNAQIEENGNKPFKTGLVASEAEVVFNVIASGTQGSKLFVEMSPIPTTPPTSGRAGGEASTSYQASRGNQITLKFKSIVFTEKTTTKDGVTIEGVNDAATIHQIIDALEKADITLYSVKP